MDKKNEMYKLISDIISRTELVPIDYKMGNTIRFFGLKDQIYRRLQILEYYIEGKYKP